MRRFLFMMASLLVVLGTGLRSRAAEIEIAHIVGQGPFVLDTHGALFGVSLEGTEARLTSLTSDSGFTQVVPFAVLRADGRVLTWEIAKTKFSLDHPAYTKPTLVDGVDHVVSLTGSDGSFAGLRDDGSMIAWGKTADGTVAAPHVIAGLPKVIGLSTSQVTTLALTSTGEIWGWGLESRGSLGVAPSQNYATSPVKMSDAPHDAIKIVASGVHSYAVLDDGHVALWGNCPVKREPSAPTNFKAATVSSFDNIRDVVANFQDQWTPTFAIQRDGKVVATYSNPFLAYRDEHTCTKRFAAEPPSLPLKAPMDTPVLEAAFVGGEQQQNGVVAVGADHSLWVVLWEGDGSSSRLAAQRLTIVLMQ